MARKTDRAATAEKLAALAIGLGALGIALGAGAAALGGTTGSLPGLPRIGAGAALAGGLLLAFLGFGLVMRGIHLNATLDTLANIRLLQEETHRARTQAAIHAHAVREPMAELRTAAQMAPKVVGGSATPAAKPERPKPKVAVTATISQMPTPAKRAVQSDQKASKAKPIKGKPFQPHPIFMARPPR